MKNKEYIRPLNAYMMEINKRIGDFNTKTIRNYDDLIMGLIENIASLSSKSNMVKNQQIIKSTSNIFASDKTTSEDSLFNPLVNKIKTPQKENKYIINSTKIEANAKAINEKQQYSKLISQDMSFLINNSKEIENLLLGTTQKQKNRESLYEERIFILEKEISNLNSQKSQLEQEVNEIKVLISKFDLKYTSITSMYFDDDNIDDNGKKKLTYESANKIYTLYTKKLFNEAIQIWREYNYQPLLNASIERSYEILAFLSKIKDRQLKHFTSNYGKANDEDMKKKNCEIFELLTGIESYKFKLSESEIQLTNLKNRLQSMIEDNNELYQQNRKLKYMIDSKSI